MLESINKLIKSIDHNDVLQQFVRISTLARIAPTNHLAKTSDYPICGFSMGSEDPTHPVLFITGGIHGLERIGVQVAWSLLKSTIDRLVWDQGLVEMLKYVRLSFIPLLNPVGYHSLTRSNGNGVDLMRNSPIESSEAVPFLLGGHRYSPRFPWFRGVPGILEIENKALLEFFLDQCAQSRSVISLDLHSGFGIRDRIWFPFSHTVKPFDDCAQLHALTHLLEKTHPYHIYQIEPQSKGYLLNGDMWDYIFLEFKKNNPRATFLPLTLEMGSWNWVKKNPWQIFLKHGAFNPIKEHRLKRTYRRHHFLYEFLLRALRSDQTWSPLQGPLRIKHQNQALEKWYEQK